MKPSHKWIAIGVGAVVGFLILRKMMQSSAPPPQAQLPQAPVQGGLPPLIQPIAQAAGNWWSDFMTPKQQRVQKQAAQKAARQAQRRGRQAPAGQAMFVDEGDLAGMSGMSDDFLGCGDTQCEKCRQNAMFN